WVGGGRQWLTDLGTLGMVVFEQRHTGSGPSDRDSHGRSGWPSTDNHEIELSPGHNAGCLFPTCPMTLFFSRGAVSPMPGGDSTNMASGNSGSPGPGLCSTTPSLEKSTII